MRVFAELNESGNRIDVFFRYDFGIKEAIKSIPGARFVPKDKGGPCWRLPLDLRTARALREKFNSELKLGDALKEWGKAEVAKERNLRAIAVLDDFPVEDMLLATKLPHLAQALRPYQRADVRFMASTNCLNLLQPRLGKTLETIGAIFEADLDSGGQLVVAPMSSLDLIWRYEWERWTGIPIYTWWGELNSTERALIIASLMKHVKNGEPFMFATTANTIRDGLPDPLVGYKWASFTIDEFHKTGLPEIKNKFPQAAIKVPVLGRKWGLSGTPMGGKLLKLWGGLHWLEPQSYTSKWRWAETWLTVTTEEIYVKGKKRTVRSVGGLKPEIADQFYPSMASSVVRRLRKEVLPQLPEKQIIDVPCKMTKAQAKQYLKFATDAEIRIDEYHLSAPIVLAEYTRLKQFANSLCAVGEYTVDEETGIATIKLKATPESGKLPQLMEKLAEVGIDPDDPGGDAQAIVCSQFTETVDMVYDYLTEKGIKCGKITGKVKGKARREAAMSFRSDGGGGDLQVMVMNVYAGGVALTLDRCESVHVLDETWNPDDTEQVTDRAINTATLHQVNVFIYRSMDTIEQYIEQVNVEKAVANTEILDLRRQGFRATKAAA